jgi:diguanylate cyclase (GGDEF)-like protein
MQAESRLDKTRGGIPPSNRILVVDDDSQITKLLNIFLISRGYSCETASSGKAAIEKADGDAFDIVITDIKMPEMDGIALTKEILRKHPDITVMVMTAFTAEYTEEDAIHSGASDFIKKPFTLAEFSARLERIIRDRKKMYDLQDLAFFDGLTGLPNRKMFLDRTTQALEHAKRFPHTFALLFLDVDNFKAVNDSFGHAAGDLLLQEIAARLSEGLRKSETVARMSGDEFIVTATITKTEDAAVVAARILDSLSPPFDLQGHTCSVSCSIGISVYPADGDNIDILLKKADSAMYHTKEAGGNNYGFYKKG